MLDKFVRKTVVIVINLSLVKKKVDEIAKKIRFYGLIEVFQIQNLNSLWFSIYIL